MRMYWIQEWNVMGNSTGGLQAWLNPVSQMTSSGIRSSHPSTLCSLVWSLLFPLGNTNVLQYPLYSQRYQRKESFSDSSIKIPRDDSDWSACITCQFLDQGSGTMWLTVSLSIRQSVPERQECWGKRQQMSTTACFFHFTGYYIFLDSLSTGQPRPRRTWDPF